MITNYLKLMRVKHYVKNLLIFLPLFFSGQIACQAKFFSCVWGFLAFSAAASCIYILNDITDAEKDRNHPVKRNRPIASGAVSKAEGYLWMGICFAAALFFLSLTDKISALCVLFYVLLNISYSLFLKHRPFFDILTLVLCYFIRTLYGSALADIEISGWLYLTIISGSFYLALGKRRNELQWSADPVSSSTRSVLKFYNYEFLDKNMYVSMGLVDVFYSLWAMEQGTRMLATVPIVLLLMMKYSYDVERPDSMGDPVDVISSDKMILSLAVLWGVMVCGILYFLR